MRARLILVGATTAFVVVGASVLVSAATASSEGEPSGHTAWQTPTAQPSGAPPAPTPPPTPRFDVGAEVSVDIDGYLTWAALDRTTGELAWYGKDGEDTNTTESMIKPWIVADHLRRLSEEGREPTDDELDAARDAIRDSDDVGAQELYVLGGEDQLVERLIDLCALTDTEIHPGWWSRTEITAVDAVRLGECLVDGTAAGPEWTGWVLDEMRQVHGTTGEEDQRAEEGFEGGRWGIIDGLPAGVPRGEVAIKNGWTRIGATSSWHVNCLAVTDEWVLAVLMRYPVDKSLDYGAERCAEVTSQLFHHPNEDR